MGFPTHAHQKQVLALQIYQAAACLLASACHPAAMCHAKGQIASLPCSCCCACTAAPRLGRPLCSPPELAPAAPLRTPTWLLLRAAADSVHPDLHTQEQRKGPNKSKTSQRIESKSTAPRSRGGKGLLSHGSKVQFSIQKL